jgi:hypothetical protein
MPVLSQRCSPSVSLCLMVVVTVTVTLWKVGKRGLSVLDRKAAKEFSEFLPCEFFGWLPKASVMGLSCVRREFGERQMT